ncbi:S41 family peptidase [Patescibacteria group bacterium]|nr:S41 family peptidase [Patescibacteria group bacterium]MBU4512458.1 S41 family peptidase [Patescibacteria group bacterium]MCG2692586.1 S41 family peptidase [Candidatus Parcubacteria bacterium]
MKNLKPQEPNLGSSKNPTVPANFRKNIFIILILFLLTASFGFGIYTGQHWGDLNSNVNQNDKEETALQETEENQQYGELKDKNEIPKYLTKDVNAQLFLEVWDIIHNKYVDPVEDIKLFYGALAGSVAALGDPYSMFLEPKITSDFTEELQGKFEGIGAEIAIKADRLTIVAPLPDTPAEQAGIKAGDKVYLIDDYDTTGITLEEAVKRIRGPQGTPVVLTVMREDNGDEPLKIEIIRDEIHFKSVRGEMKEEDIGYIKISHFNEDTTASFEEVLDELLDQGAQTIILDLRNNPGGYLKRAIDIASFWVDDDVIVIEKFGENYPDPLPIDKKRVHKSTLPAILKGVKTVVLVNLGSASGSEIVAGALQDYGLATIIGKKTFGKGSVQELEELSDGSSVKITIAKWLTPKGRCIADEGIEPDIEVEMTGEDYSNDLDPQLDKAIEIIKGEDLTE